GAEQVGDVIVISVITGEELDLHNPVELVVCDRLHGGSEDPPRDVALICQAERFHHSCSSPSLVTMISCGAWLHPYSVDSVTSNVVAVEVGSRWISSARRAASSGESAVRSMSHIT